jgi:hypothetical protein
MAEGYERLARLEELLRQPLPARVSFDMSFWQKEEDCGTAACAVGLACMDPWLSAEGLYMDKKDEGSWPAQPRYGLAEGISAAEQFFAIPYRVARKLFLPTEYPMEGYCEDDEDDTYILHATPTMVAERIAAWLKDGQSGLDAVIEKQHLPFEDGEVR